MKDGVERRKHLIQVWQQTGRIPKRLATEMQIQLLAPHVWNWFWDICQTAPETGITYQEIMAFQITRSLAMTPGEVMLIRNLDQQLRSLLYERRQKEVDGPPSEKPPKTIGGR